MANLGDRIVVLIDMDCFFCQVETKLQPQHAGKPLAVVQYNQWEMGGIIAVNYEARSFGVTRHMRGKEAKEKCPDIVLASVPCLRGKADTNRYRKAGREVIEVIRKHCNMIERASVDEAYLDITDIVDTRLTANELSPKELMSSLVNTYIVGYSEVDKNNEEERRQGLETWIMDSFKELSDIRAQKLAIAGVIVEEIRASIYKKTGFRCSAGISQNKILAKLACGLHKPNRQTILPGAAVASLYSTLPVKKVRNLGGKFGDVVVESLSCNVMGDLLQYSLEYLQQHFDEKTGLWLYNIARGVDNEPVTNRLLSKSIGACKKFPGKQAITSLDVLKHWAGDLAAEVCERLEQDLLENQRRATLLTVSYHYYQSKRAISQSRSLTLNSYKPEKVASQCVDVITKSTQCPVAYLGLAASKFVPSKESGSFLKFFKTVKSDDKVDKINTINSSSYKTHSKLNFEAREKKSSTTTTNRKDILLKERDKKLFEINIDKKDLLLKTEKEESLATVIDKKDSSLKTEIEELIVIEESSATDNAMTTKRNKRLDNSLNTSAADSPTSRKLFKLMQVCNERDSKVKRMSSMLINNDDFQDSFFMNVYKTDRRDCPDNVYESSHTAEKSATCDEQSTSSTSRAKALNMNTDEPDSDLYMRENIGKKALTSRIHARGSNDEDGVKEHQEETAQNPSVRLREIFPNMDDIDSEILLLLPADLQEEARLYMKSREKKRENIVKASTARDLPKTKGKSSKSKAAGNGKRRSPLYNFLIKTDSSEPLERCIECGQMIPVTRYEEHTDFHVAQNLYQEINKPTSNENGVKRKFEDTEIVVTSVKRHDSRPITTFLS